MILVKQYHSMVLFTFQSGVKSKLEMLLKLDFDHFWEGKVYGHLILPL